MRPTSSSAPPDGLANRSCERQQHRSGESGQGAVSCTDARVRLCIELLDASTTWHRHGFAPLSSCWTPPPPGIGMVSLPFVGRLHHLASAWFRSPLPQRPRLHAGLSPVLPDDNLSSCCLSVKPTTVEDPHVPHPLPCTPTALPMPNALHVCDHVCQPRA